MAVACNAVHLVREESGALHATAANTPLPTMLMAAMLHNLPPGRFMMSGLLLSKCLAAPPIAAPVATTTHSMVCSCSIHACALPFFHNHLLVLLLLVMAVSLFSSAYLC